MRILAKPYNGLALSIGTTPALTNWGDQKSLEDRSMAHRLVGQTDDLGLDGALIFAEPGPCESELSAINERASVSGSVRRATDD